MFTTISVELLEICSTCGYHIFHGFSCVLKSSKDICNQIDTAYNLCVGFIKNNEKDHNKD